MLRTKVLQVFPKQSASKTKSEAQENPSPLLQDCNESSQKNQTVLQLNIEFKDVKG